MPNRFKITAYLSIALLTFMAIWAGYIYAPVRNFVPALTVAADSVKATKKSDSEVFRVRYPPKKQFLNIEINSADTSLLVRAKGIGPVFAQPIVEYRERLGGYVSLEQLREIRGMDEERFAIISKNFRVDTSRITKININFADQNTLTQHPYITPNMARRLLEAHKLKGGFINHQQLINDDILTPREARKVAPYLMFKNL